MPRLILLSEEVEEQDLLATALSEKAGHKVAISVPQRGEKKDLVEHVNANAREAHGRKLAETASQSRLLAGWQRPSSCLTSHAASRSTTTRTSWHQCGGRHGGRGAGRLREGPVSQVQHQSTEITPGDDFGMMREVMTRRFSRLLKEEGKPDRSVVPEDNGDTAFPAWPDVILIDGGQGK